MKKGLKIFLIVLVVIAILIGAGNLVLTKIEEKLKSEAEENIKAAATKLEEAEYYVVYLDSISDGITQKSKEYTFDSTENSVGVVTLEKSIPVMSEFFTHQGDSIIRIAR